jgi:hypothetical protein
MRTRAQRFDGPAEDGGITAGLLLKEVALSWRGQMVAGFPQRRPADLAVSISKLKRNGT